MFFLFSFTIKIPKGSPKREVFFVCGTFIKFSGSCINRSPLRHNNKRNGEKLKKYVAARRFSPEQISIKVVFGMTEKELLYVQDALGHEQYFQTQCKETSAKIQDAELRSCIEQMASKHREIFNSFYGLL